MVEIKYLQLKDIRAYTLSRDLSKAIWEEVSTWKYLAIKTVGDQLIRAIDSIGANIAEGFGRFHKRDKIKFYYNARGSVYESFHWVDLARERQLITENMYNSISRQLRALPREINSLIQFTNKKLTI